jgi:hypothetical protein
MMIPALHGTVISYASTVEIGAWVCQEQIRAIISGFRVWLRKEKLIAPSRLIHSRPLD